MTTSLVSTSIWSVKTLEQSYRALNAVRLKSNTGVNAEVRLAMKAVSLHPQPLGRRWEVINPLQREVLFMGRC